MPVYAELIVGNSLVICYQVFGNLCVLNYVKNNALTIS